jgi:hypothetical protein
MAKRTISPEPLGASAVADKLSQVRALIGLAQQMQEKARVDLDTARIVLLDLEGGLLSRGVEP